MKNMGGSSTTTLCSRRGTLPRILWCCGSMVGRDVPASMDSFMSMVIMLFLISFFKFPEDGHHSGCGLFVWHHPIANWLKNPDVPVSLTRYWNNGYALYSAKIRSLEWKNQWEPNPQRTVISTWKICIFILEDAFCCISNFNLSCRPI